MTHYAIGDVQGCARSLSRLLKKIRFNPDRDKIWFVGDLVNRGPNSRKVLRQVMALGDSATCVLGNHDLHLLATAARARPAAASDTFDDVLYADDAKELLDWLRHRPLVHLERKKKLMLVHAGLYPLWTPKTALNLAREVETRLRGRNWRQALSGMYGSTPSRWREDLGPRERLRFTVNALTRMRFVYSNARLNLTESGPPGSQRAGLVPWYRFPQRRGRKWNIVFGHWSALGLKLGRTVTALDTGCVWGGRLTAVSLGGQPRTKSVACAD